MHLLDVAPTILDLMGMDIPSESAPPSRRAQQRPKIRNARARDTAIRIDDGERRAGAAPARAHVLLGLAGRVDEGLERRLEVVGMRPCGPRRPPRRRRSRR